MIPAFSLLLSLLLLSIFGKFLLLYVGQSKIVVKVRLQMCDEVGEWILKLYKWVELNLFTVRFSVMFF